MWIQLIWGTKCNPYCSQKKVWTWEKFSIKMLTTTLATVCVLDAMRQVTVRLSAHWHWSSHSQTGGLLAVLIRCSTLWFTFVNDLTIYKDEVTVVFRNHISNSVSVSKRFDEQYWINYKNDQLWAYYSPKNFLGSDYQGVWKPDLKDFSVNLWTGLICVLNPVSALYSKSVAHNYRVCCKLWLYTLFTKAI